MPDPSDAPSGSNPGAAEWVRWGRENTRRAAKKRKEGPKRKLAARSARARPERRQDPRLWAVRAYSQDGVPFREETWAVAVSPARLDDGRVLMWHPPMPVAFNLVQADRYRERGAKARKRIMGALRSRAEPGTCGPTATSRTIIDCIFDLQTAVLCSFLALESLANHAIETLPTGATLTYKNKTYDKGAMVRWLSTDEKYKKVLPMLDGGERIAGTATWTRYIALKNLRDELVHIKERGLKTEADDPSAYDRLMLGEADGCVEAAISVVEGAWPGFLPPHVREALRIAK